MCFIFSCLLLLYRIYTSRARVVVFCLTRTDCLYTYIHSCKHQIINYDTLFHQPRVIIIIGVLTSAFYLDTQPLGACAKSLSSHSSRLSAEQRSNVAHHRGFSYKRDGVNTKTNVGPSLVRTKCVRHRAPPFYSVVMFYLFYNTTSELVVATAAGYTNVQLSLVKYRFKRYSRHLYRLSRINPPISVPLQTYN